MPNVPQIDEVRTNLLLDAVFEIDKLARVLPGMVPLDECQAYYAVRGIAGRMLRLTHVLMSGLDEDEISNQEMKEILHFVGSGQG